MSPGERPGTLWSSFGWLPLWWVSVAAALAARPLLPIDETRYLSVAWEIWRRGDWVVPYLNGAPYSDKPPLLFWGILSGWQVFGVSEWWPRLLSPLFGLLCAVLLAHLARRLSADRPDAAARAIPFLSGFLWITYSTLVLFDTLLTACVLVALCGVVEASRGAPARGWLAYGAGVGLGALAKGPVVLIHVLPVALLAPWWIPSPHPIRWRHWYLGLMAGTILGAVIGLSWALVAAARGGPAYRAAILWSQTAGRVTHAFAHRRPWWWYLPLLLPILFPWSLWPPLWRALSALRRGPVAAPARFALAILVPGLILFSLVSGKQVHYLMPLLPAFALLAGSTNRQLDGYTRTWDALVPAGVLATAGLVLFASGYLRGKPEWATWISPWWGAVLLIGVVVLGVTKGARRQIIALSLTSPALIIVVHLAGGKVVQRLYDLRPTAEFLGRAEIAHQPIAYVGRYAGQFHFLGRLKRPFDEITREQVPRWTADHPTGLVIDDARSATGRTGALMVQPYGGGVIGIWDARRYFMMVSFNPSRRPYQMNEIHDDVGS